MTRGTAFAVRPESVSSFAKGFSASVKVDMSVIVTRAAQEEIDRLRALLETADPHINYTVEQACQALSVKESTPGGADQFRLGRPPTPI
jgi:hypothetical protein